MPTNEEKVAAVKSYIITHFDPEDWECVVLSRMSDDRIRCEVECEPSIQAAISKIVWCIDELYTRP